MSLQLRITEPAIRDIKDIADYLADQSGLSRSDQFLSALDSKLSKIAQFPNIGRLRDDILPDARSLAVENYLILYRPVGQNIAVLRVVSGYRDLLSLSDD